MTNPFPLVLALGLVLATADTARADIGVIVLEPVSALGFFTRVGHAGTYLSNICPDGSPIRMRVCLPGESGGVVIRSSALSEHEDYDWAIVPFEEYLHGFAKALVNRALAQPELHLRVRRYPQIPGTFGRSRETLFPMENAYRNVAFAPYWFFGGFREVALGAFVYHEVLSPFDLLESSRDFASPRAATLTRQERHLRQRQDAIRLLLAAAQRRGSGWAELSAQNVIVSRRLAEVVKVKRAEVTSVAGSPARWRALDREFHTMVQGLGDWLAVREDLKQPLRSREFNERLFQQLLRSFEADGEFYVDRGAPWIRLPLAEGEWGATGLSRAQIRDGDPRLAALVLTAVIDYNLHQSKARREDIDSVEGLFTLLREAAAAAGGPRTDPYSARTDAD